LIEAGGRTIHCEIH